MRIVSNTPQLLIVEDRPMLWSLLAGIGVLIGTGVLLSGLLAVDPIRIFWGAGFGSLALVMFLLILRRVRIYFDRSQDLVEIRTRGVRNSTRRQFRLQDLRAAVVQTTNGDQDTHRLALDFRPPHGLIPTRQLYASGPATHRAADAINTWLEHV